MVDERELDQLGEEGCGEAEPRVTLSSRWGSRCCLLLSAGRPQQQLCAPAAAAAPGGAGRLRRGRWRARRRCLKELEAVGVGLPAGSCSPVQGSAVVTPAGGLQLLQPSPGSLSIGRCEARLRLP